MFSERSHRDWSSHSRLHSAWLLTGSLSGGDGHAPDLGGGTACLAGALLWSWGSLAAKQISGQGPECRWSVLEDSRVCLHSLSPLCTATPLSSKDSSLLSEKQELRLKEMRSLA